MLPGQARTCCVSAGFAGTALSAQHNPQSNSSIAIPQLSIAVLVSSESRSLPAALTCRLCVQVKPAMAPKTVPTPQTNPNRTPQKTTKKNNKSAKPKPAPKPKPDLKPKRSKKKKYGNYKLYIYKVLKQVRSNIPLRVFSLCAGTDAIKQARAGTARITFSARQCARCPTLVVRAGTRRQRHIQQGYGYHGKPYERYVHQARNTGIYFRQDQQSKDPDFQGCAIRSQGAFARPAVHSRQQRGRQSCDEIRCQLSVWRWHVVGELLIPASSFQVAQLSPAQSQLQLVCFECC